MARKRTQSESLWEIELKIRPSVPRIQAQAVRAVLEGLLKDLWTARPAGVRARGQKPLPPPAVRQLSVSFVRDPEMRELNRSYRGKDKPIDVLSFAALEAMDFEELAHDEVVYPLGDLVISLDTAVVQARRYRWTLGEEILRLLIHGLLHLLGYDHEKVPVREGRLMRKVERALFARHRAEAGSLTKRTQRASPTKSSPKRRRRSR